jgi:cation:H+ antiporter
MIVPVVGLVFGIGLTLFSSDKVVENATALAKSLGVSSLVIGIFVISIGTSLPEISNSIISSILGHGNINVGDSIGSTLTQLTLVLGLLVFLGRKTIVCKCDKKLVGGIMIVGIILGTLVVEKGYITRFDSIFLIIGYYILLFIVYKKAPKSYFVQKINRQHATSFLKVVFFLILVIIGAFVTVESVITLSKQAGIPEFIIAFFGVALGTSLPELAVGLSAIRKGEFELMIGDNFGSNLTDMTLSLAAGPLIAPISGINPLSRLTGWYTVLVATLLVLAFDNIGKINKPLAVGLILAYLGSYLLVFL